MASMDTSLLKQFGPKSEITERKLMVGTYTSSHIPVAPPKQLVLQPIMNKGEIAGYEFEGEVDVKSLPNAILLFTMIYRVKVTTAAEPARRTWTNMTGVSTPVEKEDVVSYRDVALTWGYWDEDEESIVFQHGTTPFGKVCYAPEEDPHFRISFEIQRLARSPSRSLEARRSRTSIDNLSGSMDRRASRDKIASSPSISIEKKSLEVPDSRSSSKRLSHDSLRSGELRRKASQKTPSVSSTPKTQSLDALEETKKKKETPKPTLVQKQSSSEIEESSNSLADAGLPPPIPVPKPTPAPVVKPQKMERADSNSSVVQAAQPVQKPEEIVPIDWNLELKDALADHIKLTLLSTSLSFSEFTQLVKHLILCR